MEVMLTILALLLAVAGIVGSVVPLLPGPPAAYVGMLLAACTSYATFSARTLILYGLLTVAVTVADFYLPALLARRFGGTRAGAVGATLGVVGGFFFFPPLGVILGPFAGAVLGELTHNRDDVARAFRVGLGAFLSFLVGTGLKLAVSVAILIEVCADLWEPFVAWWQTL